jgi:hypothetical protein
VFHLSHASILVSDRNFTFSQLRNTTSHLHNPPHIHNMAAPSSPSEEFDSEMNDVPPDHDTLVQTLEQDLENAKDSLNKLETTVQSLIINTPSHQDTGLRQAEVRASSAEATLRTKDAELEVLRKELDGAKSNLES